MARFVELTEKQREVLTQGQRDILTGLVQRNDMLYQKPCPSCGSSACTRVPRPDPGSDSLFIAFNLRCTQCHCEFEPASGIIITLGSAPDERGEG